MKPIPREKCVDNPSGNTVIDTFKKLKTYGVNKHVELCPKSKRFRMLRRSSGDLTKVKPFGNLIGPHHVFFILIHFISILIQSIPKQRHLPQCVIVKSIHHRRQIRLTYTPICHPSLRIQRKTRHHIHRGQFQFFQKIVQVHRRNFDVVNGFK